MNPQPHPQFSFRGKTPNPSPLVNPKFDYRLAGAPHPFLVAIPDGIGQIAARAERPR